MKRLIEIYGSIRGIADALGVPYPTVQSWLHRGIPGKRYVTITQIAQNAGHVVTLEELADVSDQEDAA